MITIFAIILLFGFSSFGTANTHNATLNSIKTNQTSAVIGDNYGTLTGTGDEVDFLLDTTGGQEYHLSLTGPSDTDFDLAVYDGTGTYITGAAGISYPDETSFTGDGSTHTITVYSYSGSGDFVLTISLGSTTGSSASLGDNAGTLGTDDFDTWYFPTSSGQWYEFSLTGPGGTDFDMDIYSGNGEYLEGAYSTVYPDSVDVEGDGTTFVIEVFPYSGSGDYILTISQISEPASLQSASYSSEIASGDVFEWEITYTDNGSPVTDDSYGIADGDRFEVEALMDGPDMSISSESYYNDFSNFFEIRENGRTLDSYDDNYFLLVLLIVPTSYHLSDGSTLGLQEAFNEGIWNVFGGGNWQTDGNEIVYSESYGGDYFEIRYDSSSGLLTFLEQDFSSEYIALELMSGLPGGDGGDGLADLLPIPGVVVVLTLFAIPVLRRKLTN